VTCFEKPALRLTFPKTISATDAHSRLLRTLLTQRHLLLRSADRSNLGKEMKRKLAAATWLFLGLSYSTLGMSQTADPTADQRINDLEARVAALERMQGIKPGTTTPAAVSAAPVAAQPGMSSPTVASAAPVVVPTMADWGSLHRGMTVSQVQALLGKPGDTRVLPMSSTWYYPDTHGRSVEFDRNGRVEQWSQP
jgi:hypothetical protein